MKNFRSKIFDFKTDRRPVREGSLLVSEPFLKEHFFKHAVISLVDYGADTGAMGVVLNNRTALTLDEVLDHVRPETKVPVYCGGPLSHDRLFFIHDLGSGLIPGAREYCDGLWIGGDFDDVIDYVNSGYSVDGHLRFFIGYAGWEKGQLQGELDNDVWAVADTPLVPSSSSSSTSATSTTTPTTTPTSASTHPSSSHPSVLTPRTLLALHGDALWHAVVRTMGPAYHHWLLHPMSTHAN